MPTAPSTSAQGATVSAPCSSICGCNRLATGWLALPKPRITITSSAATSQNRNTPVAAPPASTGGMNSIEASTVRKVA
ncbi:hypothetical protein WR25_09232 [Diploscapter pachys]|uniref:Uncharacterized protein n=1 Tax=Diploscapter pachys TaxID=2018661 RepID=A0A2A2M5E8_9BILA|nr:hypothetical protein WR25_09232 [Diploscapter pachys]